MKISILKKHNSIKNYLIVILCLLTACGKDDIVVPENTLTPLQEMNKYIQKVMEENYYWTAELPNIDPLTASDPKSYFNDLVYKEKDHWSGITDNYQEYKNIFGQEQKTFGYSLLMSPDNKAAIVEFVYPNSPADKANIRSGDRIVRLNGDPFSSDSMEQLLNSDEITISVGKPDANESFSDVINVVDKTIKAVNMELNPVILSKIINYNGKKIGYWVYKTFSKRFNDKLTSVITQFKNEKITDLILDLRFNPGGEAEAARHLASLIAPYSNVSKKNIFINWEWNSKKQADHTENDPTQLRWYFDNLLPVNLNLNKITILTSLRTASASEVMISCLRPYMTVTTVGTKTRGKYTASITIRPTEKDLSKTAFEQYSNWALTPIVVTYTNVHNESVKGGISADYNVMDIFMNKELGDTEEPLLKKALEVI